MTINVNVSSKMYDTANASKGSGKLNLLFPNNVQADLVGWYVELSFVSRILTYVATLGAFSDSYPNPFRLLHFQCLTMQQCCTPGIVFIIIVLILKYLGACNDEHDFHTTTRNIFVPTRVEQRESEPLIPEKPSKLRYGTGEEDPEAGSSSSSSDELYDGKICVICYDEPRNCFFVPCGHCATCYDCAERIMVGENGACPICRRLIHKLRKLFAS